MRRSRAPSNEPGAFFAAQFSAGYITNMFGFDLRQAQVRDARQHVRVAPAQCKISLRAHAASFGVPPCAPAASSVTVIAGPALVVVVTRDVSTSTRRERPTVAAAHT